MEFVELLLLCVAVLLLIFKLLLLCVAVLLLIFKPEQEKLAWWLTVGGWFVVVFMYVGHVSTAILGSLNL